MFSFNTQKESPQSGSAELSENSDELEQKTGIIMHLDESAGFIDDKFKVEVEAASSAIHHVGTDRNEQDKPDEQPTDNAKNDNEKPKKANAIRTLFGVILECSSDSILIKADQYQLNVRLDTVEINFKPYRGDRVILNCTNADGAVVEEANVLSVNAAERDSREGTVTAVYDDCAVVDDDVYFDLCNLSAGCRLNYGDVVRAATIECYRGKFVWRATDLIVLKRGADNSRKASTPKNTSGMEFITDTATETVSTATTPYIDAECPTDDPSGDTISPTVTSKKDTDSDTATWNGGTNPTADTPNRNDSHAPAERTLVHVSEDMHCELSSLREERVVEFVVHNKSSRSVYIKSVYIETRQSVPQVRLLDIASDVEYEVKGAGDFTIRFEVNGINYGQSQVVFVIQFEKFHVKRSIFIDVARQQCEEETSKELETALMRPQSTAGLQQYANSVWPTMPAESLVAQHIPSYEVPPSDRMAYLASRNNRAIFVVLETMHPYLTQELSIRNYVARFKSLLHLEEIELSLEYKNYDMPRTYFRREKNYLTLIIKNLLESKPLLATCDSVRATRICRSRYGVNSYDGVITKLLFDRIWIKFGPDFHETYRGEYMKVEFFFSRFSLRKQHFAVERVAQQLGEDFLLPTTIILRSVIQMHINIDEHENLCVGKNSVEWFNPDLNTLQRRAVRNVLRGEVQNMPYIIFGPPGTGKSVTLVEIILQIKHLVPKARILVSSASNSSVNLIGTRLLESNVLQDGEFIRIISKYQLCENQLPNRLKSYYATIDVGADGSCSSQRIVLKPGVQFECQKNFLSKHSITLSSCTTLGNYLMFDFDKDFFTHVIIDDCCQLTESEVMVVCGMVSRKHGQVVLAGDPGQLGPYLINKYASDRGLSLSFLERLLSCQPYGKNNARFPDNAGYDPRLVTKLLLNYRSLPSILETFNEFFYERELVPVINERHSKELFLLKNCKLETFQTPPFANKSHGVFFCGVEGQDTVDAGSTSRFNPEEDKKILEMLNHLYNQGMGPKNVGIISPYPSQVRFLRNFLGREGVIQPKIGSVEEFAGQERDIILISTGRFNPPTQTGEADNLQGIVKMPRRMNVAISRARSLLICFGNPYELCEDENWCKLIQYCIDNNAYWGCPIAENST